MTDYSSQVPFLAHNSTVKAWCVTRLTHDGTTNPMTQAAFDTLNFLDGYNLRLDVQTRNAFSLSDTTADIYTGALYFSFINPLPNNKYKVFAHTASSYKGLVNDTVPFFAHLLNSAQYPKTTSGFWIRCAIPRGAPAGTSNEMVGVRFFPYNTTVRVTVL